MNNRLFNVRTPSALLDDERCLQAHVVEEVRQRRRDALEKDEASSPEVCTKDETPLQETRANDEARAKDETPAQEERSLPFCSLWLKAPDELSQYRRASFGRVVLTFAGPDEQTNPKDDEKQSSAKDAIDDDKEQSSSKESIGNDKEQSSAKEIIDDNAPPKRLEFLLDNASALWLNRRRWTVCVRQELIDGNLVWGIHRIVVDDLTANDQRSANANEKSDSPHRIDDSFATFLFRWRTTNLDRTRIRR